MKKLALHWKIIIGMVLGVVYGLIANKLGWVDFKPVATIMQKQNTIDAAGNKVEINGKGRHDACVVPRAVPIVESMMALTLVDAYLRSKTNRI